MKQLMNHFEKIEDKNLNRALILGAVALTTSIVIIVMELRPLLN